MIEKKKKAISPVIATVIIVAVAIMIAVAVAYWVTGIIPAFTRYEELKISNAYIDNSSHAIIELMNTGSADATIDNVFVKNRSPTVDAPIIFLPSGNSTEIIVLSGNYEIGSYQTGVIYEFIIHTSAGGSYPVSARSP